jgi:hypothetical protein
MYMLWSLKQALLAASAAALSAAAVAPSIAAADPYDNCDQARQANQVAGAVIGGVAGAVVGHGVAGHDDRGAGSAVGAVAGGSLGAGLGGAATHCDAPYDASYDRGDYHHRFYGYPQFRDEKAHIRAEIDQGVHQGWLGDDQATYFYRQLQRVEYRETREFGDHGWSLPPWDAQQIRASLDRIDHGVDRARDYAHSRWSR